MAKTTKINRKFLFLIGGFVLFVGVVIGGLYFYSYSAAPERNINLGDALVVEAQAAEAAGDADEAHKKFQSAISRYGRAVSKKPNNLAYTKKMIDTLAMMTPRTSSEAQELNRTLDLLLQKRTRAAPLDGTVWIALLDSLTERANVFPDTTIWKGIVETCDAALDRLPPTDPHTITIQSVRLDALMNLDTVSTAEEMVTAETEMLAFLKANPSRAESWAHLLESLSRDTERLSVSNRGEESQVRSATFDTTLADAKAAIPNSPVIALAELQHLIRQKQLRIPTATPGAIHVVLDPILWADGNTSDSALGSASTLSPRDLMTLADICAAIREPVVFDRTILAMQHYCQRNPKALVQLRASGKLQQAAGKYEDALATFERIITAPPPKVSMLAAFADEVKVSAIEDMFEIKFGVWEDAKTPTEKSAAREHLRVVRDRLAATVAGRDGELSLIRADAKLAFTDGDYLTALTKMEEVFARDKKVSASLYLISVISLIERGESGAALVKINRAIDDYPTAVQFLFVRARIEASLGRALDAKRSIQALLTRDPDNAEARAFLDVVAKVPGDGVLNLSDYVVKILGDGELLAGEGQITEAIASIRDALLRYPTDLRLQRTICQWLLFAGQLPEAQELVAKYLAVTPNDPTLQRLSILASISSPVDRVAAFVEIADADGTQRAADLRAVDLVIGLTNLRDNLKARLAADTGANKAELTTQIAETVAAAQAAIAKAIEIAPGNPTLLDRLYTESVSDKKPEEADQLVVLAEKFCKDPTISLLLRGRIALDRQQFAEAISNFEKAQVMPGASATVYRLLGYARERAGDVEGARESYATAYERRPNDQLTVQLYTSLLARSGKTDAARMVLRNAMMAMPEAQPVRNAYYDLEALYGNIANAILERRRMYAIRPAEAENARQLMRLLIESVPSRELMFNQDGSTKFGEKEWESIGKERQDQELAALREFQGAEAETIFDRLKKMDPNDRTAIRTYAAAMQRAGRGSEAEAVMQKSAEEATIVKKWQPWVELAELQLERGRRDAAVTSFAQAIALDQGAESHAARVIAAMWSTRHQPARGLEVLNAAFTKHPSAELARLIATMSLETRDFVTAKRMSDEVAKFSSEKPSFSDRLLAADIANAELDEAFNKLTPAEIERISGDFARAVDDAIRLDPASQIPFMARASSFQRRFQRSGKTEDLRAARADIERAIQLQGSYWPSTRMSASILVDGGDVPAAIHAVRLYVEQSPRHADSRRALMGYQIMAGDFAAAVRTADAIIALEPRNPTWYQALAEAHIANDKKLEAAGAYERMFAITKNPEDLTKAVMLRLKSTPPDFENILANLRLVVTYAATNPFLQMVGAAAISGSATNDLQRNQGLIQLRQMYAQVATSQGALTDPWAVAVTSLFGAEKTAQLEAFVLEACGGKPDSSLCRALAQQFIEFGTTALPKAQEYATRALEIATTNNEKFNALRVLGGVEYSSGRFKEAAEAFEQSLVFYPEDVAAVNNLAFLEAAHLNKAPAAVERARKAFAMNATNADLMDTLGFALYKAGELPEAISFLRRAARSQPNATAYAHLGAALLAAKRQDEALEALNRAKGFRRDSDSQALIDELDRSLNVAPGG
ncbi:MAG: tetratricopeptide repeat protein [Phycisphaerales bacterium]|nr:tetratricopeptide repeat protein [Phycisphaerales bacterium]